MSERQGVPNDVGSEGDVDDDDYDDDDDCDDVRYRDATNMKIKIRDRENVSVRLSVCGTADRFGWFVLKHDH